MSLRALVDRIVVWVRKVEDAGPDPAFRTRRCPNPEHVGTEFIATRHGTVLRHWCSVCGADLITPRGRIYGGGQRQERKP